MTNPEDNPETPDIDTVADALTEMMPSLGNHAASKVAKAVLAVLYDAGWRKHDHTQTQRPPMELLRRWSLYDAFDDPTPEQISRRIGLNPISPDVQEMERKASLRRLQRVLGVRDFVMDHAAFFAGVFIGVQREQHVGDPTAPDVPDAYWAGAEEQMSTMLRATCMSLLATLYGLDIVQEGKGEVLHGL